MAQRSRSRSPRRVQFPLSDDDRPSDGEIDVLPGPHDIQCMRCNVYTTSDDNVRTCRRAGWATQHCWYYDFREDTDYIGRACTPCAHPLTCVVCHAFECFGCARFIRHEGDEEMKSCVTCGGRVCGEGECVRVCLAKPLEHVYCLPCGRTGMRTPWRRRTGNTANAGMVCGQCYDGGGVTTQGEWEMVVEERGDMQMNVRDEGSVPAHVRLTR
eukprot:GEMP01062776.1.p1 GENE.GEMP01062776.1~~GEMP01062776.1.p1  ORF type:complete len:228 (+),score=51.78 GEMP01062776.1:48-686(+)